MTTSKPPTGITRLFWRSPIFLYKIGLGKLLGKKFLLLKHIGRNSGLERLAVLEVVRYEEETNSYYISSGFGWESNWYLNLQAHPKVVIQVGSETIKVDVKLLSPEESGEEMVKYARKNPKLAKNLTNLIGHAVPESIEDYRELAAQYLPFVLLIPRDE